MNVGIYTNSEKDTGLSVTKRLLSLLQCSGFKVYLHSDVAAALSHKNSFDTDSEKMFDTLLTVGGDGTILRIASYCARHGISVLGINMGKLGFLTEVEVDDLDAIPQFFKKNNFIEEKRSLLSFKLDNKDYFALNDVVLGRSSAERMIALEVSVDGMLADRYYCDGYIISTPTGSTAYSLSAGGCVLSPKVNALSLISINSHSLHSRPIIINDSSRVSVKLLSGVQCDIIADGCKLGKISPTESIFVGKADKQLSFLRFKDQNFYERLLAKLNTWSVTL